MRLLKYKEKKNWKLMICLELCYLLPQTLITQILYFATIPEKHKEGGKEIGCIFIHFFNSIVHQSLYKMDARSLYSVWFFPTSGNLKYSLST